MQINTTLNAFVVHNMVAFDPVDGNSYSEARIEREKSNLCCAQTRRRSILNKNILR